MMKLHGMARSNYYNLIKAALLEKGMAFEEVSARPSQEADYLAKSPMGRVPCLETEEGFISESFAILEYLEALQPQPALLPSRPFARAKVIEMIRHLELNVELVARRALPAAFFGAPLSDETRAGVEKDLARGMAAVSSLSRCDPFLCGAEFTAADLYAYYTFGLASAIIEKIFATRLLDGHDDLSALLTQLAQRPSIAQVTSSQNS